MDAVNAVPPTVSDAMIEVFEKIAKKLRFEYDPRTFSDPTLKDFYAKIEALAYDENEAVFEDDTVPDKVAQDRRIEELIQEFNEAFAEVG